MKLSDIIKGPFPWDSITGKPVTFAPTIGGGAGDAVAGNDARLGNARTPTAHTHPASDISDSTEAGRAMLAAASAAAQAAIVAPYISPTPTALTAIANVKFGAAAGAGITHVLPADPVAGDRAKYYVTASGGDRTLDFATAIKVPSDSALSLPKTMTSGKTYIVLMEHNGTNWMLVSLVGGY